MNAYKITICAIVWVIAILLFSPAYATDVCGIFPNETIWRASSSPYTAVDDIEVPEGGALTIEPGVTVKFSAGRGLYVYGKLTVFGEADAPVVFTSGASPACPGDWKGIVFHDSAADAAYDETGAYISGSICRYARVTYAESGVTCVSSSPYLDNCQLQYCRNEINGAGIKLLEGADPIIRSCVFRDNLVACNDFQLGISGGAGIYVSDSHPLIENCLFERNGSIATAGMAGGTVVYLENSDVSLRNCVARDNSTSGNGAVIYAFNGNLVVSDSTFENNYAEGVGGAVCAFQCSISMNALNLIGNVAEITGGGGYFYDSSGDIDNCTISDNNESGIAFLGGSVAGIRNSVISGNKSRVTDRSIGDGGGIYSVQSSPIIENCVIENNEAHRDGGGCYFLESPAHVRNCKITGNTTQQAGGGVTAYGSMLKITACRIGYNRSNYFGGGVYLFDLAPQVSDCFIYRNEARFEGDGIYCAEAYAHLSQNTIVDNIDGQGRDCGIYGLNTPWIRITNSIIWGHPNDLYGVQASHCNTSADEPGVGNIRSDPKFVDSAADDYHIGSDSPCIDAGSYMLASPSDIDGDERPLGLGFDIGADEFPDSTGDNPYVSGVIDADDVWTESESPVIIVGDVTVTNDATLTIEPGAQVLFAGRYSLAIESGTLIAAGSPELMIRFQPAELEQPNPGDFHGIIFESGSAPGQWDAEYQYVSGSVLEYCLFDFASNAIVCRNASPYIAHCEIRHSLSFGNGGGITCVEESGPLVFQCLFGENRVSGRGGAIFVQESHPKILSCDILSNSADQGGGIYLDSCMGTIESNRIIGNSGSLGGGITIVNSDSDVIRNRIGGNIASCYGGGIYYESGSSTKILNNWLYQNEANEKGGGLFVSAGGTPYSINNTFFGNVPDGSTVEPFAFPYFINSIFWNNCGQDIRGALDQFILYCNIEKQGIGGEGTISADPGFVAPDIFDFHLSCNSPCLDGGRGRSFESGVPLAFQHVPTEDFDNDWRGDEDWIDIGADEYLPGHSPSPTPSPTPTPTATRTNTPIPSTPTARPGAPTNTPLPNTPIPPTLTPLPGEDTPTPMPDTPAPPTNTVAPGTPTYTPLPESTPTPTKTVAPGTPTSTPRPPDDAPEIKLLFNRQVYSSDQKMEVDVLFNYYGEKPLILDFYFVVYWEGRFYSSPAFTEGIRPLVSSVSIPSTATYAARLLDLKLGVVPVAHTVWIAAATFPGSLSPISYTAVPIDFSR